MIIQVSRYLGGLCFTVILSLLGYLGARLPVHRHRRPGEVAKHARGEGAGRGACCIIGEVEVKVRSSSSPSVARCWQKRQRVRPEAEKNTTNTSTISATYFQPLSILTLELRSVAAAAGGWNRLKMYYTNNICLKVSITKCSWFYITPVLHIISGLNYCARIRVLKCLTGILYLRLL